MALSGLLIGAFLWLIMMGSECFTTGNEQACSSFSPTVVDAVVNESIPILYDSISGASYIDPRDNVLFLRQVVWIVSPALRIHFSELLMNKICLLWNKAHMHFLFVW